MSEFQRTYRVIWANLDPNRHMRHTAYNDFAAQARVEFFTENGLSIEDLVKMGIGPILFREDTRFLREVGMNELITVGFAVKKARKDGSKWSIRHNIIKESGELSCTIDVEGAWLDLVKRKVSVPPKELIDIMLNAPRTEDFEWIPEKTS